MPAYAQPPRGGGEQSVFRSIQGAEVRGAVPLRSVDEFVIEHLREFDGKQLKLAEKADLNLNEPKKDGALSEAAAKSLSAWLKESLGDKVGEVRVSQRLVDSPAVVVDADKVHDGEHAPHYEVDETGQRGCGAGEIRFPKSIPRTRSWHVWKRCVRRTPRSREVWPSKSLTTRASRRGLLEDPRTMLNRLNQLLEKVLAKE